VRWRMWMAGEAETATLFAYHEKDGEILPKRGSPLVGLDLRRSSPNQKAPRHHVRAMLDVPRELARYLGWLLYAERRRRGTRKKARALTCLRQAVLGLRWFRQNVTYASLHVTRRIANYVAGRHCCRRWSNYEVGS
jgi:hypothetical protein